MKKLIGLLLCAVFSAFCVLPAVNISGTQAISASSYKQVKVYVIVLKTQKEAAEIKAKLDKGENFYMLAKKYSIVDTGKKGGDCGFITKDVVDKEYPEFSQLALTAKVGYISQPTKTQDGWSIVKLAARTY